MKKTTAKKFTREVHDNVARMLSALEDLDEICDELQQAKLVLAGEDECNVDNSKTQQLYDMLDNVVTNFKETKMCLGEIPEDFTL